MSDEQEQVELTPEQIAELKAKATKAEELEKAIAEKEAKLKEYETDENQINWRKSRKQIKAMDEALKKKGLTLDEETDEVKSLAKEFSEEDIDKRAEVAAERVLINKALAKAQRDLNEEDKALFTKYYEKASHGETVNSDNVDQFIDMAWQLSGSNGKSKTLADRAAAGRGGAPRVEERAKDFSETDRGAAAYSKMFPDNSFNKKK